jgi:hypothetical protein
VEFQVFDTPLFQRVRSKSPTGYHGHRVGLPLLWSPSKLMGDADSMVNLDYFQNFSLLTDHQHLLTVHLSIL